jgi:hypothetical protein
VNPAPTLFYPGKKPVLGGYQAKVDNLSVNIAGFDTRRISWEEKMGKKK